MNDNYIIGVDIGGTKVRVGILDPEGNLNVSKIIPTNPELGVENTINRIILTTEELIKGQNLKSNNFSAVSIGVPGSVELDTGTVLLAPNIYWKNVPLGSIIREYFQLPTFIEQDTKIAALGEFIKGAGKGSKNCIYITVSTGIGSGIIIDGNLVRGSGGTAGEIGHMVLDPYGPQCTCGNRGCLQMLSSGPAIATKMKQAIRNGAFSIIENLVPNIDEIKCEDVIKALKEGDNLALQILEESTYYLGLGISYVVSLLNPEVVILGGGVVQGGDDLVINLVKNAVQKYSYPLAKECVNIVKSKLRENAVIVGTAFLPRQWK